MLHKKIAATYNANIYVIIFVNSQQFWFLVYKCKIYTTIYVSFSTILVKNTKTKLSTFMLALLVIFFRRLIFISDGKYLSIYVNSSCFPQHFNWHIQARNIVNIYDIIWYLYNLSNELTKVGRNKQHQMLALHEEILLQKK